MLVDGYNLYTLLIFIIKLVIVPYPNREVLILVETPLRHINKLSDFSIQTILRQ